MTCFHQQIMFLPKAHPNRQFADWFERDYRRARFKYNYSDNPHNNEFNKYYPVQKPCYTCIGCRLDHASDWAVRIYCELMTAQKGCFVTFTYAPDKVPLTETGQMTLKTEDTQKIWHDLRQKYPELNIRYVIAGEYGTKSTKRPHYHACIFGYEPEDLKFYRHSKAGEQYKLYKSKELTNLWGKGIVIIGRLEYKSACYVARYVQKKAGIFKIKKDRDLILELNQKAPTMKECYNYAEWITYGKRRTDEKYLKRIAKILFKKSRFRWKSVEIKDPTKRKEEFILSSLRPAIGLQYWKENKEKIKRNNGIFVRFDNKVKLKPIPTYFKKKWKEENPEEYYKWAYKQQLNSIKELNLRVERLKVPNWWTYTQKIKFIRELEEKALLNKIKLSKLGLRENFVN